MCIRDSPQTKLQQYLIHVDSRIHSVLLNSRCKYRAQIMDMSKKDLKTETMMPLFDSFMEEFKVFKRFGEGETEFRKTLQLFERLRCGIDRSLVIRGSSGPATKAQIAAHWNRFKSIQKMGEKSLQVRFNRSFRSELQKKRPHWSQRWTPELLVWPVL